MDCIMSCHGNRDGNDFVDYIINKKSYELAHAFPDLSYGHS